MKLSDEQRRRLEAYQAKEDEKLFSILRESARTYSPPRLYSLNNIDDRRIVKFIELLNSNPHITSLSLSCSTLTNYGISLLVTQSLFVTKLHLDGVALAEAANNTSTIDTLLALAKSKIRELMIIRTVITNEEADVLIENSRQVKLNIRDNRHVDEARVRRADKKAEENSQRELGFFGSPNKKAKQDSQDGNNPQVETPADHSPE